MAGDSRAGRAAAHQVSWELHRAGEILRQVSESIATAHGAESRISYTRSDQLISDGASRNAVRDGLSL